jgi:hypothetical protein
MMMTVEVFTALPVGRTIAEEGRIVRCPLCGRNGLLQADAFPVPRCLHAETTTVLGDGMLVEPTDCCCLPRLG